MGGIAGIMAANADAPDARALETMGRAFVGRGRDGKVRARESSPPPRHPG